MHVISLLNISLQFFKGLNVTGDQKKFFKKALNSYYDAVAELLQSEHAVSQYCVHVQRLQLLNFSFSLITYRLFLFPVIFLLTCLNHWKIFFFNAQSLRVMEIENAKILSAKGELSDENTASYEKLRKTYDHLLRGVSSWVSFLELYFSAFCNNRRVDLFLFE